MPIIRNRTDKSPISAFGFLCFATVAFMAAACTTSAQTVPSRITALTPTRRTATTPPSVTTSPTSRPSATPSAFNTPTRQPSLTPSATLAPTLPPLPTLPAPCGKTSPGLPGTQSQPITPTVIAQGTAILCGQIYFAPDGSHETITISEAVLDLDTGSTGTAEADIEFHPSGGSMIFYALIPIHSATTEIWSYNGLTGQHATEPTYEECRDLANPFRNDNEPEYACVLTNAGNVARIKVEAYNPLGNYVLAVEISFVTWGK